MRHGCDAQVLRLQYAACSLVVHQFLSCAATCPHVPRALPCNPACPAPQFGGGPHIAPLISVLVLGG